MDINLNVKFSADSELVGLLKSFFGDHGNGAPETTAKAKKETPVKSIPSAPASVAAPTAGAEENGVIDIEMIRAIAAEKMKGSKRDFFKALLEEFKLKKLTDLQPASYETFYNKVKAL